ncbi:hypothetical protein PMIN05_004360 [Paraphaeosphaeria minitans]
MKYPRSQGKKNPPPPQRDTGAVCFSCGEQWNKKSSHSGAYDMCSMQRAAIEASVNAHGKTPSDPVQAGEGDADGVSGEHLGPSANAGTGLHSPNGMFPPMRPQPSMTKVVSFSRRVFVDESR